jgi:hypothetical protein
MDDSDKIEGADMKIPGSLAIWQSLAAALGGALFASVLGVNTLQERSAGDQKTIASMQGQLTALVVQVQTMSTELARQGERIELMRATQTSNLGLRIPRN